jgi:DNA-binding transcriptional MerR regulator
MRYEIVLCRRQRQLLTLDGLAAETAMHPALVQRFIEYGLIEPAEREGAMLLFEVAAVSRLRTIRRLRESLGINVAGVAVVLDLLDKCSALQRENELLRSRL